VHRRRYPGNVGSNLAAPVGQTLAQPPHPAQTLVSIWTTFPADVIAPDGQASMQRVQPTLPLRAFTDPRVCSIIVAIESISGGLCRSRRHCITRP